MTAPRALERLAFPALLLLGACGDGGEAPVTPRTRATPSVQHTLSEGPFAYRRLELADAGGTGARPGPSSVLRQAVTAEAAPLWNVRAEQHELLEVTRAGDPEPVYALRLVGDDPPLRVGIPGPIDPRTFNQLVLTVKAFGQQDIHVAPRRGRATLFRTAAQRIRANRAVQTLIFDLPELKRESEPLDEIGILFTGFTGGRNAAQVVAVELVSRPWSRWLPGGDEEARLIEIGQEWRRAKGVSADWPLVAHFEAPPGAELVLACGLPDRLRSGGARPVLEVLLRADGMAPRVERIALEEDFDEPARWHDVAISLAGLEGREVEARFQISDTSDELALCAVAEPAVAVRAAGAPAVVLVTSDTHRADHVGIAPRGAGVRTPFLDALAARGVYFTNVTSPTNVTNPSHVALMTGTYPRDTGVVDNYTPLSEEAPTLAERYRDAGWKTWAAVSAVHLGNEQSGLGQGFDRMTSPADPQRDSVETIADLEYWLADADGLPLFIWLHLFDAHAPYAPPEDFRFLYYEADRDPTDDSLPEPDGRMRPHWAGNVRDLEYLVAQYKSEVSYVDHRLEQLLSQPRFEDALLAVTSDHGESLMAHEVYWDHRELYPDTLFVPMILAGPGAPAGRRVELPVRLIDLGRTLLDLSGLEEAEFPGWNLLELDADSDVVLEPRYAISASAHSSAILLGRWFLVLHLRDHPVSPVLPKRQRCEIELYDLEQDPECLVDLRRERTEEAARLRELLVGWLLEARAEGWRTVPGTQDPEVLRQLEELGYANGGPEIGSNQWFDPDWDGEWCDMFK